MERVPLRRIALMTLATMWVSSSGSARQADPAFSIEDVTVAEGDNGTSVATFRVVLRNPNLVESRIHYVTVDGSATAAAVTQSSGSVMIPAVGTATPYPATINVSGLTGTVQHVAVRLNQLAHTFPADLDVLLVGPDGQAAMVMSDIGVFQCRHVPVGRAARRPGTKRVRPCRGHRTGRRAGCHSHRQHRAAGLGRCNIGVVLRPPAYDVGRRTESSFE